MQEKFPNVSDKKSDNYSIVVQQCTDTAWELTTDIRQSNDSYSSLGVQERKENIRGTTGDTWHRDASTCAHTLAPPSVKVLAGTRVMYTVLKRNIL